MSYTRKFTKAITSVHEGSMYITSDDVGKFKSYHSEKTEYITFEVTVDTEPFDESVDDMKEHVDILTGTIAATEAAQVASIRENSRKIGQTIVAGFFKTVRSDISQQIAQLKIKTDTLLIQLHELAKRCNDKRRVMTVDYQRISSRYAKIFDELNKELENRIHSIDEPVFRFVQKSSETHDEINKSVGVPTIHASENARLHSKITAAHAKKMAIGTLDRMHAFLSTQYRTDRILSKCLLNEEKEGLYSAPYCVIDARQSDGNVHSSVYCAPMIDRVDKNELLEKEHHAADQTQQILQNEAVKNYFNSEVAHTLSAETSTHNERVAKMTLRLMQENIK